MLTSFVALLRAVNVGGTGKLPMADLKIMCEEAGFRTVRTYIASGNVLFQSSLSEEAARSVLEARLHAYAGKLVAVVIRTAAEMAGVVAANPFPDAPGNRVLAIFLPAAPPQDALRHMTRQGPDDRAVLGAREIYVLHGSGMAESRLKIPAAKAGTARNMNTVAKLAELAGM